MLDPIMRASAEQSLNEKHAKCGIGTAIPAGRVASFICPFLNSGNRIPYAVRIAFEVASPRQARIGVNPPPRRRSGRRIHRVLSGPEA
jgi:hypothetical protein